MLFGGSANTVIAFLELKHCDCIILHELRADRPANQGWELPRAHRYVLFNLYDAYPI